MVSTADRPRSERLTRGHWIEAALDALVEQGIEGVRIDRLCRTLGVTKGSFYHHFAGRDDLLEGIADYWAEIQPADTRELVESFRDDPMRQLATVTKLVADRDIGRRDHAMRAWAAADEHAAHSVQRADRHVLALLERILAGLGVAEDEVYPLARVLFFTALGAHDAPLLFDGRSRHALSGYLLRLVRERAGASSRHDQNDVQIPGLRAHAR
jgi:AcrR family transcriptional regulator